MPSTFQTFLRKLRKPILNRQERAKSEAVLPDVAVWPAEPFYEPFHQDFDLPTSTQGEPFFPTYPPALPMDLLTHATPYPSHTPDPPSTMDGQTPSHSSYGTEKEHSVWMPDALEQDFAVGDALESYYSSAPIRGAGESFLFMGMSHDSQDAPCQLPTGDCIASCSSRSPSLDSTFVGGFLSPALTVDHGSGLHKSQLSFVESWIDQDLDFASPPLTQYSEPWWISQLPPTPFDTTHPQHTAIKHEPPNDEHRQRRKAATPSPRRRHKCPNCSHTSSRANNMKEHILTHNPNRPKNFACPVCDRRFARKHDMKRHISSHDHQKKKRDTCTSLKL